MQLTLRRGFGYAFDPRRGMRGLGQSGEVDTEGTALPTDILAVSSSPTEGVLSLYDQLIGQGVSPADAYQYDPTGAIAAGVDPSTLFPLTAGVVTPGVPLTPAELAAEQSRASAWLATIPGAISTASKIAALTTAQIAAGVQSGALKPSSTCPSGYMLAGSAQCTGVSGAPLIPGVSNTALAFVAIAFLGLMLMGNKR
jgi:hypothetical protein